jgi:hypothetical protein
MRISEQTATFALYSINWLVFITVVESVYSAVRTDFLCKASYVSSLKKFKAYKVRFKGTAVVHGDSSLNEILTSFPLVNVYRRFEEL